MGNYEYIVASLPDITTGWKFGDKSPQDYIEEIVSLCSKKDNDLIEFLLNGYKDENLNEDFYIKALTHNNRFIREFFKFDLNVRNAKVTYLNKALDRPAGEDVLTFSEDAPEAVLMAVEAEFEEADDLETILNSGDILTREKGIDDLVWEKINNLTTFNYFDIEVILGFIAKLNIVSRWYKLDEQTGREMFKRLVDEVRGTFKGVEYNG
jgi:hypothetical protein